MDIDSNEELVFYAFNSSPNRLFIVDGVTAAIEWDSQSEGFTTINIAGYLELTYNGLNENYGYGSPFCDVNNDGIYEIAFYAYDGSVSRIYIVGSSGSSSVKNINIFPSSSKLEQNYPNPFNPSTTIRYILAGPENISIKIYNVSGQVIKEITRDQNQAGEYEVVWDGKNDFGNRVSSGTYFYQIKAGNYVEAKKMILIK